LELSEFIECELLTFEIESEAELGGEKEVYSEPEGAYIDKPLADEN